MKETLAALNIKHITTSFYSPQANGAAEKAHLTLMNVLSKKIQGNPEIWDLYLGQACAAINFSVHESSKFSPFFLLYNRYPVLPVDSILSPRQKYNGEDVHRLALEKQHEAFMLVHKHLREAKKKSARRFNEEADNEPFQVGDPVYLKNHTRKSKLDGFAAAFYRIVEQKSPHTFLCRNQLDGTIVESHARHMRHARIDRWKITKQDRNRKLRKARYVVSPPFTDTEPQEKEKPLDRLVKMKTSFACHRGLFEFNVMPFGLSNAPAVFQELMSIVLHGLGHFAVAYLDDILVFSESMEEHLQHLETIFSRLRQHELRLKLKKCSFLNVETQYLGFIIHRNGIRPDPKKVEAIRSLPVPTCVREVRSFIGMSSYYRRFIPNFSEIAEPIIALTKKHAHYKWTHVHQKAFDYLKESLSGFLYWLTLIQTNPTPYTQMLVGPALALA